MSIIAPRRTEAITDNAGRSSIRFADVIEGLVNVTNKLRINTDEDVSEIEPYTTTNVTEDRTLDATLAEISISDPPTQEEVEIIRDAVLEQADVLGTLIADLQAAGIIA